MMQDTEWNERIASADIKFRLKLNPVQSKCVQETLHHIHTHHNTDCDACKNDETDPDLEK